MSIRKMIYRFLFLSSLILLSIVFVGKAVLNYHIQHKTSIECLNNCSEEEECNDHESFDDLIIYTDLFTGISFDFDYQNTSLPFYKNLYLYLTESAPFTPPEA